MVVNYERFNSFFFFFSNLKGEDYLKFLVVSLGLDKIVDLK